MSIRLVHDRVPSKLDADRTPGRLSRWLCAGSLLILGAQASAAPLSVTAFDVKFGTLTYNLVGSSRTTLPWDITGIKATFSTAVTGGDVSSLSGTGLSPSGFTGLGSTALTWTFPAALADGSYSALLAGSGSHALTDTGASPLNAGAGFTQNFRVLFGDINGDGTLDNADVTAVNDALVSAYSSFADVNGDGVVDLTDIDRVRAAVAAVPTTPTPNPGPTGVPEPMSLALASLGMVGLWASRRRAKTRD